MSVPWPLLGVVVSVVATRPWRRPARPLEDPVAGRARPSTRRRPVPRPDLSGVAAVLAGGPPGVADRETRRRDAAVAAALPEVVDLLLVGVGAGLTPRETMSRCRSVVPAPFGEPFEEACRRASRGDTFAAALDRGLGALGPRARPLLAALVAGDRDGAAFAISLRRVGDEARRRRRIDAQTRARRLPVLMLVPLVLCVLPSFALLSIGPLVLASLVDLGVA